MAKERTAQQERYEEKTCIDCHEKYTARILPMLGMPQGFILGGGRCPSCRRLHIQREELLECQEHERQIEGIKRSWLTSSGIPPDVAGKGFTGFDKTRLLVSSNRKNPCDICYEYADRFQIGNHRGYPSMVLFSPGMWGVGKTHLAAAITEHIINKWDGEGLNYGSPVRIMSEPELFRRIRATYSYTAEERMFKPSEQEIINNLIMVPLLIIDDIGKEEVADPRFVQRTLFAVIDGRYRLNQPLVMTMNMNDGQLLQHLGGESSQASFDRMWEMCKGRFVKIEAESYRRKQK